MTKQGKKQVSDWQLQTFRITVKRLDNGLLLSIDDGSYSASPPVPDVDRAFQETDWDWIACAAEKYMRSRIAVIKAKMTEGATQ